MAIQLISGYEDRKFSLKHWICHELFFHCTNLSDPLTERDE